MACILAAFACKPEGFDVVGRGHQVGFRRQFVGGMAPVGVGEGTELAAFHEGLDPLLDFFEIGGPAPGGIADVIGQGGGLFRIGL